MYNDINGCLLQQFGDFFFKIYCLKTLWPCVYINAIPAATMKALKVLCSETGLEMSVRNWGDTSLGYKFIIFSPKAFDFVPLFYIYSFFIIDNSDWIVRKVLL